MIKETYFPTSLYVENLNVDNERLASNILKIKKEDPEGIYRSNIGDAYHSKQNLHLLPEFFEIRDLIFNTCLEIKKEQKITTNISMVNLWANVNDKGGSNDIHTHGNSFFSGVYYVKTPENSGSIRFLDPRPQVETIIAERKIKELHRDDWNKVQFKPAPGMVVIFPSYLPHQVFPNKSEEPRISMSFNIILKL
tara:strand:- start:6 stop:587 length:582 start_codon:yes stop_codon:yes gene_type:complete